jgi:hypothetical protein
MFCKGCCQTVINFSVSFSTLWLPQADSLDQCFLLLGNVVDEPVNKLESWRETSSPLSSKLHFISYASKMVAKEYKISKFP